MKEFLHKCLGYKEFCVSTLSRNRKFVTNSLLISLIAGGNGKPKIRLALFRFDDVLADKLDRQTADQAFDFGNRPDQNGDKIPAVREDAGGQDQLVIHCV